MKTKYRVDRNCLILTTGKGEVNVDGKWLIDEKNKLVYVITEREAFRKKYSLPNRVSFEGKWSLDRNHDFIFTLNQTKKQAGGEEFYLKAELLDVKEDALIFSLASSEKSGVHKIRLLQLKGKWQADKYNRLQFFAQRAGTLYDTLTFGGTWDINQNNTLIYTYQKTYLKKKEKVQKTLTFKGYWQISSKNRISYILDLENNSHFSFKAHLETPTIVGKRGAISYRTGIGVKGESLFKAKVFTLYGLWKLERKLGLSFELDYGQGRVSQIRFGVSLAVAKKNEFIFQLKNARGKDLGISVAFSRSFLNNQAEWFVRLIKDSEDSRIEGGLTLPW
jgi:hypothetical protein